MAGRSSKRAGCTTAATTRATYAVKSYGVPAASSSPTRNRTSSRSPSQHFEFKPRARANVREPLRATGAAERQCGLDTQLPAGDTGRIDQSSGKRRSGTALRVRVRRDDALGGGEGSRRLRDARVARKWTARASGCARAVARSRACKREREARREHAERRPPSSRARNGPAQDCANDGVSRGKQARRAAPKRRRMKLTGAMAPAPSPGDGATNQRRRSTFRARKPRVSQPSAARHRVPSSGSRARRRDVAPQVGANFGQHS